MLFNDNNLKIAEELAWQMLDGFNHAYCPDLKDYAFFYYNGKVVLDPWMNENEQVCFWSDHESSDVVVNPVIRYPCISHNIQRFFPSQKLYLHLFCYL